MLSLFIYLIRIIYLHVSICFGFLIAPRVCIIRIHCLQNLIKFIIVVEKQYWCDAITLKRMIRCILKRFVVMQRLMVHNVVKEAGQKVTLVLLTVVFYSNKLSRGHGTTCWYMFWFHLLCSPFHTYILNCKKE